MSEELIIKAFSYNKCTFSRIEQLQDLVAHYLKYQFTTIYSLEEPEEDIDEILHEATYDESKPERKLQKSVTNSSIASVLPLLKIANNLPCEIQEDDKQSDKTIENFVKQGFFGYGSYFEITLEFSLELQKSILLNFHSYEELLQAVRENTDSSPCDDDYKQIFSFSVNYCLILRSHLLCRIYFFYLKQLFEVEIDLKLLLEGQEAAHEFLKMVDCLIKIQNFIIHLNRKLVYSHNIANGEKIPLDSKQEASIGHIIEVNKK